MPPQDCQYIDFPPNSTYWPQYDFPPRADFDYFGYVFPVISNLAVLNAAGSTASVQVTIDASSDFELRRLNYHFDLAGAAFLSGTRPIPNVLIQIQDSGAGRNLFNNPVPLSTVANFGEDQRDLPWPKIFARNSTIIITLTNVDAAVNTGNYRVMMLGRKIFTRS